ncbi:MAG: cytochrome c nitrite reductase small subunit [Gemmatimonadota bacterium]|nr:cytochrome c nitrite reductase small subunit [Gemmatimonadota bacterium]
MVSTGRALFLAAAILAGSAAGLGLFTFGYAKGGSYLTDDPAACANCHVMQDQYDAWIKSSHRAVATCNDCHTPHTTLGKYATKARNGFLHSVWFTLGGFPEPIRITAASRAVTERTCRACHAEVVDAMDSGDPAAHEQGSCIRCHAAVGHWTR